MKPTYGMNAVSAIRNQRHFDFPRLLNLADAENRTLQSAHMARAQPASTAIS
jgi:hypothetical protein